jgi:hypothetical protein
MVGAHRYTGVFWLRRERIKTEKKDGSEAADRKTHACFAPLLRSRHWVFDGNSTSPAVCVKARQNEKSSGTSPDAFAVSSASPNRKECGLSRFCARMRWGRRERMSAWCVLRVLRRAAKVRESSLGMRVRVRECACVCLRRARSAGTRGAWSVGWIVTLGRDIVIAEQSLIGKK